MILEKHGREGWKTNKKMKNSSTIGVMRTVVIWKCGVLGICHFTKVVVIPQIVVRFYIMFFFTGILTRYRFEEVPIRYFLLRSSRKVPHLEFDHHCTYVSVHVSVKMSSHVFQGVYFCRLRNTFIQMFGPL